MKIESTVPRTRDLPPGRLAARRNHLLAEVERGDVDRDSWVESIRARLAAALASRQRRLFVALAVLAGGGALIVAPAAGLFELFGRDDVDFAVAPPAPSIVKRDFADMSSGAPKGMDPQVMPGAARLAGTFDYGGSQRQLWVAPTADGGFCYLVERLAGGCTNSRSTPLVFDGGFVLRTGASAAALDRFTGRVFAADATTLLVHFEDDRRMRIPFIYVSPPINAGFFAYKPTAAEERVGQRPAALLLLDPNGTTIARETFDWAEIDREARAKYERFKRALDERLRRARTSTQKTP